MSISQDTISNLLQNHDGHGKTTQESNGSGDKTTSSRRGRRGSRGSRDGRGRSARGGDDIGAGEESIGGDGGNDDGGVVVSKGGMVVVVRFGDGGDCGSVGRHGSGKGGNAGAGQSNGLDAGRGGQRTDCASSGGLGSGSSSSSSSSSSSGFRSGGGTLLRLDVEGVGVLEDGGVALELENETVDGGGAERGDDRPRAFSGGVINASYTGSAMISL